MFNNKNILITGGTGSFGQNFVSYVLKNYKPNKIVVFSRDEMKQWDMAEKLRHNKTLRFFIGDVRDKDRLHRAFDGIDYVIHAAANKIVPIAEYNPFECIKTNIIGAMNVLDVSIDRGVKKVIALSTDKASSPINLYGATKLVSDKLFVSGNSYSGTNITKFSVVRYGNVMGSRGSVIPFFLKLNKNEKYPITDINMTRFMITLDQGVNFVIDSLKRMQGGEIFVKKIPSMKVIDILNAINPNADIEIIGIRPGEKIHEQMISRDEALKTYEFDDYYVILPSFVSDEHERYNYKLSNKVNENFSYNSFNNHDWMDREFLTKWIKESF